MQFLFIGIMIFSLLKLFIMTTEDVDVTSIRMHLNELKTKFEMAMIEGGEFAALKKIYMEIKELECHLNVMEWEANKRKINGYFTRPHYPLL